MDLADYEIARARLLEEPADLPTVGRLWRQHAAEHLARRLDTELRAGQPRVSTDDQALAWLKGAARDLRTAANALHHAALRFRSQGQGWDANRTYHAACEAAAAADGLDPM